MVDMPSTKKQDHMHMHIHSYARPYSLFPMVPIRKKHLKYGILSNIVFKKKKKSKKSVNSRDCKVLLDKGFCYEYFSTSEYYCRSIGSTHYGTERDIWKQIRQWFCDYNSHPTFLIHSLSFLQYLAIITNWLLS